VRARPPAGNAIARGNLCLVKYCSILHSVALRRRPTVDIFARTRQRRRPGPRSTYWTRSSYRRGLRSTAAGAPDNLLHRSTAQRIAYQSGCCRCAAESRLCFVIFQMLTSANKSSIFMRVLSELRVCVYI
jgi:hypothetical protein